MKLRIYSAFATVFTLSTPAFAQLPRSARLFEQNCLMCHGHVKSGQAADATATGRLLWETRADEHSLPGITGAPAFYDGRLYVPVASREEPAGVSPNYPCCMFRGSAVALDAKLHAFYVGRGNAYVEPAPERTDAILALDLDSGKVLWVAQDTPSDAWLAGCTPTTENCPKNIGPDYDFGASPILRNLPSGTHPGGRPEKRHGLGP